MSPWPRPTSVPSVLIYPTIWPQYTNVTNRQDTQTERDNDSVAQGGNFTCNGHPKISGIIQQLRFTTIQAIISWLFGGNCIQISEIKKKLVLLYWHSALLTTTTVLKVICNGVSQNWWKVVSSCLLQYKSVYVINFDKLRCKMLKSKRLVVFLYSYSSAHRHAWRHIRMCLFLFALLLRLDKKLFYPFSLLKSLSVWQKCYI